MNVGILRRITWLPLLLLWLTYTILGWYLSAHHIFLVIGTFVAVVALAVAWKSLTWLEDLIRFSFSGWFLVLIFSASIALLLTSSLLFTLIFIPVVTTFLAAIEMRFAGFSKRDIFLVLTAIAGISLGLGEVIDLGFLPSMRY